MSMNNDQIKTTIETLKNMVQQEKVAPKFHVESDADFQSRIETDAKTKLAISIGLSLLGNVLENLSDLAHAANTYSSKP